MNRNNRRWMSWIGAGIVLAVAATARAGEVALDYAFSPEEVTLQTLSDGYTRVSLLNGATPNDAPGTPRLPALYVQALVPSGAQVSGVRVEAGNEIILADGVTIYPQQQRLPKSYRGAVAFSAPSASIYAAGDAFPAEQAVLTGAGVMRNHSIVYLRINPLRYIGASRQLLLAQTMRVIVEYPDTKQAAASEATVFPPSPVFDEMVSGLVANPSDMAAFAPEIQALPRAALDYLIITSPALSNSFQQIADYRASATGGSYSTRVITTNYIASTYSGADIQAKIRVCISNMVASQGTTMVLLGGDDTIVPDRNCSVSAAGSVETEMPTDLYYSGLGGTWNGDGDSTYGETGDNVDLAWDVIVGRLPMRTATQVTNYLNKVMTYETGWSVTNKIMLGGPNAWDIWTGTDRPSDDVTGDGHAGFRSTSPAHDSVSDSEAWLRRLYRDGIHSYWPATVNIMCDTITSWDTTDCGSYLQSSANTAAKFNLNYTHLMFSGHGAPQEWGLESGAFDDSDASSQTGLTAFVYTDACLTGHFDRDSNTIDGYSYTTEPCLGEAFLRNTRARGGALAYMGCARYGWGEPGSYDGGPSTVYAYKFYKRMYETTGRTLGLAYAMHKADMAGSSTTDDCERWIQFGVNLLGDPALKMPTGSTTPTAPSFGPNPGPVAATSGIACAFTVTASGYPAPVLSLQGTTAASGYSFTAGTGLLNYTPPSGDIGIQTFTFRATNTQGSAMQTVTVTVATAPPAAPASIWASATNDTSFTAAWSSVSDATGYRLDVGTNAAFTGAGGAAAPGTNCSHDGTLGNGTGGTWDETGLTQGSGYLISLSGDVLITPAMDFTISTDETLNFKARTYGGANAANNEITVSISTDNGSNWSVLGTRTPANTTLTAMTPFDLSGYNGTQVKVKLENLGATASVGAGIDDVLITNMTGGAAAYFLPGYSNRTVVGTSQSVTGLASGVHYYFRARAVNAGGESPNSSTANVTTTGGAAGTPPNMNAIPAQSVTVGSNLEYTVSATTTEGDPILSYDCSSAVDTNTWLFDNDTGDFLFIPTASEIGNVTFSFTATDKDGTSAASSMTVTVSAAASSSPVISYSPSGTNHSASVGNQLTVTVNATDADGDEIVLTDVSLPSGAAFAGDIGPSPVSSDFIWTPSSAGTFTATFEAEDDDGAVTSTIQIVVSEGIPAAPASIWASATNATDFTAAWSTVSGATSYRLDVGTNNTFTSGGGEGTPSVVVSNAASSTTPPADWTYNISGLSSSYLILTSPTNFVVSEAFSTEGFSSLTVDFMARTYGGTADGTTNLTVSISSDNGTNWTEMGVVSRGLNTMAAMPTLTNTANLGSSQTRIRWQVPGASASKGLGIQTLVIQGTTSGSQPWFVPGYSDRTVVGTSQAVTGLTLNVTYYFRARAVNASGTSPNSSIASVTTAAGSGGGETTYTNWMEDDYGLNPTNSNCGEQDDYDEDGIPNEDEYNMGTDPTDGNTPPFAVEEEAVITANTCELTIPTVAGRVYSIYTATNLVQTNPWTLQRRFTNSVTGDQGLVLTNSHPSLMYRISVKAP